MKGKVEAGVKYLKDSFLAGRFFTTLADLDAQLDAWLGGVANVQVHGTTKQRPVDRYAHGVKALRPAVAIPRYDTRELLIRKVQPDCHVCLAGSAYSVPSRADGRIVHVRVQHLLSGEQSEITLGSEVIAQHRLAASGERATLSEHGLAIREAAGAYDAERPPARTLKRALLPSTSRGLSSPGLEPVMNLEYEPHKRQWPATEVGGPLPFVDGYAQSAA